MPWLDFTLFTATAAGIAFVLAAGVSWIHRDRRNPHDTRKETA